MYGKYGSFNHCWNNAVNTAGFRERYAIEHATLIPSVKHNGTHKLWVFEYSADDPYQDANGATYDVTEGRWVG